MTGASMAGSLLLASWVLVFPLVCLSATLEGNVLDPQHRVIVGAPMKLSCGRVTEDLVTDARGQFAFPSRSSFERCSLTVSYPGFEIFSQVLHKNPGSLSIELAIVADKQIVGVNPQAQDLRDVSETSVGGISVSDADLKGISNLTEDLIRYAKALAGADNGEDAVYVDGLPSTTLPPATMVARIDINPDPFSAEYSDNDRTHINITTKNADRHLRFNFGGAGIGVGGGNPLAPGLHSVSHLANLSLTGPVPRLPLTFSFHGTLGSLQNQEPIQAITSLDEGAASGVHRDVVTYRSSSGQLDVHYSRAESSQVNFSYSHAQSKGINTGVGGLTLPAAGSGSFFYTRGARITYTNSAAGYLYRGGFVFGDTSSLLQANSSSVGVTVAGAFVDGGAPMTRSQSHRTSWTWKNVVQSSIKHHLFSGGFTVTRRGMADDDQPNAYGVIEFSSLQAYAAAQAGSPTGTLFLTQGNGQTHYASIEVAPFVQGELLHNDILLLTVGVRADYQSRGSVLISPHLSLAARKGGFVFRAGAGRFVHAWPEIVFMHVIENSGLYLRSFIVDDVSLAQASGPILPSGGLSGNSVLERLSPTLTQPRDWMVRASIEHPFGHFTPGLEYSLVNGQHLLGSERISEQISFLDILESNRTRRRQQLHVRLRFPWKAQTITAHYQWIRSRDNTSGPFSFPEYHGNLAAEWARSAGIAPQNFSLVDNFKLPGKLSLNLIASSRGSAPYNITTGLDNGDRLYNDRGGRPRNSGNGPRYKSLDLSGYRRIPVPISAKPEKRVYVDLGVQMDNLLGNRNYISVGSVTSSPLFGSPLSAGSGRTLRFWLNLD
jgi:hypothetical protein